MTAEPGPQPPNQWHKAVDRAWALSDAYPRRIAGRPPLDTFAAAQVLALLLAAQAQDRQCQPDAVPLESAAFLLEPFRGRRLEHYLEITGASTYRQMLDGIRWRPPAGPHDELYYRNARTDAHDIVSAAILAADGGVRIGDHVRVLDQQFQDRDGPPGTWAGTIVGVELRFVALHATAADPLLYIRPARGGPETTAGVFNAVLPSAHRDQRRVRASLHRSAQAYLKAASNPDFLRVDIPRYLHRLATLRDANADAIIDLFTSLLPPPVTAAPRGGNDIDLQLIDEAQRALGRLLSR